MAEKKKYTGPELAAKLAAIEKAHKVEIEALLNSDDGKPTEALGAVGGEYTLGKLTFPAPSIGRLFLLSRVEGLSPKLINGEATIEDLARALYVLVKGTAAIQPLMSCDQRLTALEADRKAFPQSPEMYAVWSRHRDEVLKERVRSFDEPALAFLTEAGAGSLAEVQRVIEAAINDAVSGFAPISEGGDADEKKTVVGGGSRSTGWLAWPIRWLRNTAGRWSMLCGNFRRAWRATCSVTRRAGTAAR